jgi:glycosyltransferase involved in cell wall biosynthesis
MFQEDTANTISEMTMQARGHRELMGLRNTVEQLSSCHSNRTLSEPLEMNFANAQEVVTAQQSGQPLVTVIIPAYNRAWALGKTIRSVFEQTYRPIECLIVDDGSTDETSDTVEQLVGECPVDIHIRYFRKENGGANSARNWGLVESKGEYICYLDSDDLLLRDSIAQRARILIDDPCVDFCYGLASIRDENGEEIGIIGERWPPTDEARIAPYLFDTNSPLIRRSTCARAGLWREDLHECQEYEYFSRLKYMSAKVYFINRILSVYVKHRHESIFDKYSVSYFLAIFKALLIVKALLVYGKYDNSQERRQLATEFKKVAKGLYRLGDYSNALSALKESLILNWNAKVFVMRIAITPMATFFPHQAIPQGYRVKA